MSDDVNNSQEGRDSKEEEKRGMDNGEENAKTVSDNNDIEGGDGNSGDAPYISTNTIIAINQEENIINQPPPASAVIQEEAQLAIQMIVEDLQGTGEKSMSTSKSAL